MRESWEHDVARSQQAEIKEGDWRERVALLVWNTLLREDRVWAASSCMFGEEAFVLFESSCRHLQCALDFKESASNVGSRLVRTPPS